MALSMNRFEKLRIFLRAYFLGKGFYRAADALEFAGKYHNGTRKDGITPEYQHQLEICQYIRTLEPYLLFPEDTYIAALLHDTKEDYGVLLNVIQAKYGESAAVAVDLLDKNGKEPCTYFNGVEVNAIASVVKGADRINNVQSMVGVFSLEKQLKYVDEVEKYFIPMLKSARKLFLKQEPVYQNMLHMLRSQLQFLKHIHAASPVPQSAWHGTIPIPPSA
jgi:(p)ppGpp synthase/HD superfamily hydrolase